ncbi:MAG: peptidylprolyl isomerase [Desulfobulbaceae bacterium]|uniref:Peptidyl-prolyl cis-trans isomerase n=1 Tax=Candidatus Desulfatifera sulfidica TaxID=2841691 RepID=A0A8J6N873_9BACT|nr:peptidylprolyl isomerase [Candidatus Desulfatifera sulfidica]
MAQATKGNTVKVKYTGRLVDGTVFDSSEGKDPLEVTLGSGHVIAGFDEALVGMAVGEKKTVEIPVDKAYGSHDPQMVMEVPLDQVPPDLKPEVGQKLQVGGTGGEIMMVEVRDITDSHIYLDANPPLAGQDLVFDLELVAID